MLVKYLVCIGICLIVLFFSIFLLIVCGNMFDKCEKTGKTNMVGFYATLTIIGFLSSVASGIGTIVLIIQMMAKFLQG